MIKKKIITQSSINKYLDIPHLTILVEKNISEFISTIHSDHQDEVVAIKIREYIKNATSGVSKSKYLLQEYIKIMLLKGGVDIYEIDNDKATGTILATKFTLQPALNETDLIIPFHKPEMMTTLEKFEIILYKYKNINAQGYDEAFKTLSKKYSPLKIQTKEWGSNKWYEYTEEDINKIYEKEAFTLTFDEKVEIIVKLIYQQLYGLKEIDTLAYSDLNEVGVSNNGKYVYCWCDKKIRLSFINLSEEQVRTIQERSISFDDRVGQLDENNPEVLCHRADNARITAVQKPFFSSRNLCIRIFNNSHKSLYELVPDNKKQSIVTALVKAGEVISLQGPLGIGKSTTMKAMIGLLDDQLSVGTIEDHFEQHNMDQYPHKRIVEAQVTSSKSLISGIKALLRMSVDVASLGEARDGESLYSFIQLAQTIGLSSWFTTHVSTPEDTVPRFKNLLMGTGLYKTEHAAISDIVSYINVIFQHGLVNGERDITDIVEIVPLLDNGSKYAYSMNDSIEHLQKIALIQQIQQTPSNLYRLNPILKTFPDGTTMFLNYPSPKMIERAARVPEGLAYMKALCELIEKDVKKPCPYQDWGVVK